MLSIPKHSSSISWWWHGIQKCLPLLEKGLCFAVGEHSVLNCWEDPWVSFLEFFKPKPRSLEVDREQTWLVADLWCLDSASWKTSLIFELFEEASATAILQLPPPRRMGDDVALWLLSPDSVFTVKNAYSEVIRDRSPLLPILSPADWKSFWRLKLPDRLKHFLWRVIWNSLQTHSLLSRCMQGLPSNFNTCQVCGVAEETVVHLFLECPFAIYMWRSGPWPLDLTALGLHYSQWWSGL